jgi:AraC family transcriptional regulator of adaptative response / DNA-3-methyladenine glycosylase II
MDGDPSTLYRAFASRDRRFEGRFVIAVRTTRIYCRPGCPARLPRPENVCFYPCPAAAEEAGFRACRRCRPEATPGSPAWAGTSASVSRALRLIEGGALDGADVEGLAARLGIGERHLRRLFAEHLGASPIAVARSRRLHFARRLLDETELPMTEVALAAGFASTRRFNEEMRAAFGEPPTGLRRARRRSPGGGAWIALRLAYRPPLDWDAALGFLAARAIPGVERVSDGIYRRTAAIDGARGLVEVSPVRAKPELLLRASLSLSRGLGAAVARVGRLFDLGADPAAIAASLGRDARLGPLVAARPGLRVPGAWDGFELAVRAVLGQQVSVKAATTLAGRLVEAFGEPIELGAEGLSRLFPSPARLAEVDVASIGLPAARAATIRALATAVRDGALAFDGALGPEEEGARLMEIAGIGPWTAAYIAMRALGEPDAFPAGDLVIRKALAGGGAPVTPVAAREAAEALRPFRAYAAMHLWKSQS